MPFHNRTAVITGAAGRIGMALAEELGQAGVELALADLNAEKLVAFTKALQAKGITAEAFPLDITDSAAIDSTVKAILARFGKVDILVNNAGAWPSRKMLEMDDAFWNHVLELNLTSVFRMTRALAPQMITRGYGRIINLGSIAGESGLPGFGAYSVSKAGVIMMTKVLAMEFAKKGITVNCVSPGMIWDEKAPCNGTWLGRSGTGDEISRCIAFLADDDASYITGVDYTVDGGRILGPHNTNFE